VVIIFQSGLSCGSIAALLPCKDTVMLAPITTGEPLVDGSPNQGPVVVPLTNPWRISHAALGAVQYALSLLLMLVVMTYNNGLFVALIVGYFVGELIFPTVFTSHKALGGQASCHHD